MNPRMVGLVATLWLASFSRASVGEGVTSPASPHLAASEPSASGHAWPQPSPELLLPLRTEAPPSKTMHPAVVLRDRLGRPVREASAPVSARATCGDCHDTDYIRAHGGHFELRRKSRLATSSPAFQEDPGENTADARVRASGGLMTLGGPAPMAEPNCFYCHVAGADTHAAAAEALSGDTSLVETLTLRALGLYDEVTRDRVRWDARKLSESSTVTSAVLTIQAPDAAVCGTCHGATDRSAPELEDSGRFLRMSEATGQVFSGARVADSSLNVQGRESASRAWDVHAQRLLSCSDCHFVPNDPGAQTLWRSRQVQPVQEVRTGSMGDFLRRPDHRFARGAHSGSPAATAVGGATVECRTCHEGARGHAFLPKMERHLATVACESCHVPVMIAPSQAVLDFTLPAAPGKARSLYRGTPSGYLNRASYIESTKPLLLKRTEPDGSSRWAPYNLITTWFWVEQAGSRAVPVPDAGIERAFFDGRKHKAALVQALDRNGDARLSTEELVLDAKSKVELAQRLLREAGVREPTIVGETRPMSISHGVARARDALRRCEICHSADSQIGHAFVVASNSPWSSVPKLLGGSGVSLAGALSVEQSGKIVYRGDPSVQGSHVLGKSRLRWIDFLGGATLVLTVMGVFGHGVLRLLYRRRGRRKEP